MHKLKIFFLKTLDIYIVVWYNNSIVKRVTLKTTYILKFESLQGGKVNIMNKETATREEIKELIDFYNKRNDLEKQTAVEKTLINILKAYPKTIEYYYRADKIQNAILFNEEFVYCDGVFYMDVPTIPQKMYDCVVEKENKPKIRWILRDSRGSILNKYMEISPKGDIDGNYNDGKSV